MQYCTFSAKSHLNFKFYLIFGIQNSAVMSVFYCGRFIFIYSKHCFYVLLYIQRQVSSHFHVLSYFQHTKFPTYISVLLWVRLFFQQKRIYFFFFFLSGQHCDIGNMDNFTHLMLLKNLKTLEKNHIIFYRFLYVLMKTVPFLSSSLLKVHLQLKSFSVFIDVERLEAGKFDNNLLDSVRKARHFLLVLTANALDRCIGDTECKDWVHRVSIPHII